jgi:hypothetical protein
VGSHYTCTRMQLIYIFGKVRTKQIRQCTNKRHMSSRDNKVSLRSCLSESLSMLVYICKLRELTRVIFSHQEYYLQYYVVAAEAARIWRFEIIAFPQKSPRRERRTNCHSLTHSRSCRGAQIKNNNCSLRECACAFN